MFRLQRRVHSHVSSSNITQWRARRSQNSYSIATRSTVPLKLRRAYSTETTPPIDPTLATILENSTEFDKSKKKPGNPLVHHLVDVISLRGPISIATYMTHCLSHPQHGYYMKGNVIGKEGDFITSPEISQMFGELIGVWSVALWTDLKKPKTLRLVELGPGKGTLSADILRIAQRFREFGKVVSLHLIEMSPSLRRQQAETLGVKYNELEPPKPEPEEEPPVFNIEGSGSYLVKRPSEIRTQPAEPARPIATAKTDEGIEIFWHSSIDDIPEGPLVVIAQEFFDALPVHQFQFTEMGWRERMIDIDDSDSQEWFRIVVSKNPTPASSNLLRPGLWTSGSKGPDIGDIIEVCPSAMAISQYIGNRINRFGGGALFIDYGQNGPSSHSVRAIKQHKFVDLFETPGEADLSADVDFAALRRAAESTLIGGKMEVHDKLHIMGPITQEDFLKNLGIDVRLTKLLRDCQSEDGAKELISAYRRLVDPNAMGTTYKVLGLSNVPDKKFEAGFI